MPATAPALDRADVHAAHASPACAASSAPAPADAPAGALSTARARFTQPLWVRAGVAVVGGITLLATFAVVQASRAPSWWAAAHSGAPDAPALAERVERGIATELHRGRPEGEAWSVALSAEQVNAWLTHRFPLWLANQRSRGAAVETTPDIRAAFAPGVARFAACAPGSSRIVSLALRPRQSAPGNGAGVRLEPSFAIGRLGLPSGWVLPSIRDAAREESARAALDAVLEGDANGGLGIDLEDGRRVRLLSASAEAGRLVLTFATERPTARR